MRLSLPLMRPGFASGAKPAPVLPNFRRQRSRTESFLKHGLFLAFCVWLGLLYGFFYTMFPPQLLVYLVLPIGILAVLVIWALPDTDRAPTKLLRRLFFAYVLALILWPNYLAFQIPGLPWMTLRRLISFPMIAILLICYSTSSRFRTDMGAVVSSVRPIGYMIVGFMVIQFLTIFLSTSVAYSFNLTLNYWLSSVSVFFVAAWALMQPDRGRRMIGVLIGSTLFLCILGLFEYRNQALLWAGHIPSFLQVQDEVMLRYMSAPLRDGVYRVTTSFSVSLSFAEFLALVTPFVIHKLMKSTALGPILAWLAFDLMLLGMINLTQSRLGIVGWLVAHVVYGCVWGFRRWKAQKTDLIGPAVSLIYPLGAFLFFIGMFTVPAIRNRTIGGGSTGFSDNAREIQFDMMWPKLFANPFGYGSGNSGVVLGYRLPGGLLTVDSYMITLLLDYGVIGFGLFAGALIYAAVKTLQIAWRANTPELELALPIACALVIAIQSRLVLSQLDNIPMLYILLGMAAGLVWQARKADEASQQAIAGAKPSLI